MKLSEIAAEYAGKINDKKLSEMFDVNFMIPKNSAFSTVIGTALCG